MDRSLPLSDRDVLVVLPSVPAGADEGQFILDEKVVSGWTEYAALWAGRTRLIFRSRPGETLTFGRRYRADDLPGDVLVLDEGAIIPDEKLADAAVILAAGDSYTQFDVAPLGARLGVPVCYIIEYTLATRLRITWLSGEPLLRRVRSALWQISTERKRRKAFHAATALQANGKPAADAYRHTTASTFLYFDTRLRASMMATDSELAAKADHLVSGQPLRLAFTGRLNRMKGAHHLLPVADALAKEGVPFTLDIYGSGDLEDGIRDTLRSDAGRHLRDHVRLHSPIDFSAALVPWLRTSVDLFLCCHLQGDPSCTYLETLGCGVPIVGYANEAWAGILETADVGWLAPFGSPRAMARKLRDLDADRPLIVHKARAAREFSSAHSFENVFNARIAHLRALAAR